MPTIDHDDVQGLVYHAYGGHPYAAYLFFAVKPGRGAEARAALHAIEIARARGHAQGVRVNIAFGYAGLQALGVAPEDGGTFPREFRLGMTGRHRILGDEPSQWQFGRRGPAGATTDDQPPLDVLLLGFTKTQAEIDAWVIATTERLAGALELVRDERATRPDDGREHFGFKDGIANPAIDGIHGKPNSEEPVVATGEFLLGYPNAYAKLPFSPSVAPTEHARRTLPATTDGRCDLGKNGTFLVYRKLQQDVGAFRGFVARASEERVGKKDAAAEAWLASRIVGRWQNGAPIQLSPADDGGESAVNTNDFLFRSGDMTADRAEADRGTTCPFGAHIRRANPRDALLPSRRESLDMVARHRILRRGRPYGERAPDPIPEGDKGDRGIVFLILNANIERQFEFIQQTWINSSKFDGLSDETDPLIGVRKDFTGAPAFDAFSVQGDVARERVHGLSEFVKMLGGGYFFLPSLRALRFLLGAS